MTIERGTRLGPYEVVSQIGEGGMGVVWQARDTRLERVVAIKVLPAEYAESAQFRLRFDREAKAISSLNHPHICTLFDVGDGYLVMELLDGESLADRIRKGPLLLEQVLRYGTQIAQALDAAHRQGIVHRDLKPGNVMLTKSGAKLLDFGLAKNAPFSALASGFGHADQATEHKPLTAEGMILGTFQYMAPEQLEGAEADARTDIFALGALLYEMATGKRAFAGNSKTSLIAAIVSSEPAPIASVAPMTPPALEHVVKRCLEKDPDDRWQSAHDIAGELQWISEAGSQAGVAAPLTMRRKTRERLAWSMAALFLLAALALGVQALFRTQDSVRQVRSAVLPPEGVQLPLTDEAPGNAVPSPDGKRLVYLGSLSEGGSSLYLHDLASGEVRMLPETADAQYPFWSPDSRWIGFFTRTGGAMNKIDTEGGPPVRIAGAINGKGGTWNAAGEIVFTPDFGSPLSVVSAAGGEVREVTKLDLARHNSHRHPRFLPDGRRFLFFARSIQAGLESSVMLGSLDGAEPRELMRSATQAEYTDGHILFVRGETLMAQRFDPDRGELEGEPRPLAEGVMAFGGASFSTVAAAREGILVYHSGSPVTLQSLEWRDAKTGAVDATIGDPAAFRGSSLSRSAQLVAATIVTDGESDLWTIETGGGMARRIPEIGEQLNPVWTLDEKSLAYASNLKGRFGLYRRTVDGGDRVETLLESQDDLFPLQYLSDGTLLVVLSNARPTAETRDGIYVLEPGARQLTPLLNGALFASVSPDSRWIAWQVRVKDGADLFIAKYPALDGRRQLMNGTEIYSFFWSANGRELYYADRKSQLFAIDIQGDTFASPRQVPITDFAIGTSADGRRILAFANPEKPQTSTIRMIQNWKSAD